MDAVSGDLAFLPLGGTGEIGMNLNLYRCDGKWLAIDCGIGFGAAPTIDSYLGASNVYLLIAEEMGLLGLGARLPSGAGNKTAAKPEGR